MRKALLLTVLVVAATAAAPAASEPQSAAETLDLHVAFGIVSNLISCPADVLPADVPPAASECRARTGTGFVRGLGSVSETYTWPLGMGPPTCPAEPPAAKPLPATGRLSIAGRGTITFTLAQGARCVRLGAGPPEAQNEPQEFTITGGTGPFAGASGRGTVTERRIGGGVGAETWTGTLEVPGLTLDLTPPTLSGAAAKTVRAPKGAKSVRVTYKVTARDDVNGALPASCQPRSGSRFKIGRTTVGCTATDSSGNTANATFTVTVKRRR